MRYIGYQVLVLRFYHLLKVTYRHAEFPERRITPRRNKRSALPPHSVRSSRGRRPSCSTSPQRTPPRSKVAVAAHDLVFSLVPYTHHAARRWNKPELDPSVRVLTADDFTIPTPTYVMVATTSLTMSSPSAAYRRRPAFKARSTHAFCPPSSKSASSGESSAHQTSCRTPDCADNPLRYKFSWSPRGGLLALLNSASFLANGAVTHVAGADLMASAQLCAIASFVPVLEESPNRNSVPFRTFYRIPEAHPVVRGTLQYVGLRGVHGGAGEDRLARGGRKGAHLPVPGDITGLDRALKQREDSDASRSFLEESHKNIRTALFCEYLADILRIHAVSATYPPINIPLKLR
ncbi:hypothetical protein B0H14DRAFT_3781758 [Mycena olivaceomarginata]|nr:hypothetical protein B0H14DRAFT_3781758 [Mycena olivaceomarginata]